MLNKGMIQPTQGAGLSGIINKSGKQAAGGGIFAKLLAILEQHGKAAAKASVFAQGENSPLTQAGAIKQSGLNTVQKVLPTKDKQPLVQNTTLLKTEASDSTTAPGHKLPANLNTPQKEAEQTAPAESLQQAIATVLPTGLKQSDNAPVVAAIKQTIPEPSNQKNNWQKGKQSIASMQQAIGQGNLAKNRQTSAALSPHGNSSDTRKISGLNTGLATQAGETEQSARALLNNTVNSPAGTNNAVAASISAASPSPTGSGSLTGTRTSLSTGQSIADNKQTAATIALKHQTGTSTDILSKQETEPGNPAKVDGKTIYTPATKAPDNPSATMAAAQNSATQHTAIQNNAIQNTTLNHTQPTASGQSASATVASLSQQAGEFSQGDTSGQQSSDRGNQDAKTFSISTEQRSNTQTATTSTSFSSYLSHKAEASMGIFDSMQFIAQSAKNGKTKLEIQLEPANLGKIHVSLQTDAAKQLQVHLIVDQSATRQAIEQQMPTLRHALAQQGLDLSGFSMSSQDQGNGFDHQFGTQHRHAPTAMNNDNLAGIETLTTTPSNPNGRDALGGLSIRI